jgi:hypothetical protein
VWSDDAVTVLKLHGSIDWLRCPACNKVFCTPGTPVSARAVKEILVDDMRFLKLHGKESPCCYRYDPSKLEPCIIAPTPRKEIAGPPLSDIWNLARTRLQQASDVFIGYSLRSTDNHVRDLVVESCKKNRPRLLVINRDLRMPLRLRYEALGQLLRKKPRFWLPRDASMKPTASGWLIKQLL